jgi:hypothetical protein
MSVMWHSASRATSSFCIDASFIIIAARFSTKQKHLLRISAPSIACRNCCRVSSGMLCRAGLVIVNVLADFTVVQRAFQSASAIASLSLRATLITILRKKGSQHASHRVYWPVVDAIARTGPPKGVRQRSGKGPLFGHLLLMVDAGLAIIVAAGMITAGLVGHGHILGQSPALQLRPPPEGWMLAAAPPPPPAASAARWRKWSLKRGCRGRR